jgi:hypothetical protein
MLFDQILKAVMAVLFEDIGSRPSLFCMKLVHNFDVYLHDTVVSCLLLLCFGTEGCLMLLVL